MRTRLRLAVVLSVIALAGCGVTPTRPPVSSPGTAAPTGAARSSASQPPSTVAPTGPSNGAQSDAQATAFTTRVPPSADAQWTAIHWRTVRAADPLTLVRSVLRWRDGFIAVGWAASSTPVWTSHDGAHWEPLPFDTATSFWPGLLVVGVAEVSTGLVALTAIVGPNTCGGAIECQEVSPPVLAWTSPDGRTWTSQGILDLGLPAAGLGTPLLAAGPAGLVAASTASPVRVARSFDGSSWWTLPSGVLPAGLAVRDVVRTTTGFTAVGVQAQDADHDRAVALQSVDGSRWTGPYPLGMPAASAFIFASTGFSWAATGLVAARKGLIAVGNIIATPGAALWWHSANGRSWRPLPSYPPLGPTTCTGEGCGNQPNGALVGDGHRMVAVRGGADAGAWTSADGLAWRRVPVTGDIPGEQATQAVLLPGGVLLSDGTTTWFGEAAGQ